MGSLSSGDEEGTQAAASSPKSATQIIRETELARINALAVNEETRRDRSTQTTSS
jgi:hypothetical protein